ncbi:hypothetical protein PIB30_022714 [Stylosanthes scabra]|uniref:Uncharacterized protein n=1 Tax=Stylosanthes scabra TaxID=79078 RepID=A0ABU6Y7X6_9FABA|nr:hypothetical protein [Stylosanthes scabra]
MICNHMKIGGLANVAAGTRDGDSSDSVDEGRWSRRRGPPQLNGGDTAKRRRSDGGDGLPARTTENCGFFTDEQRRGQMRCLPPSREPSTTVQKGKGGGDGGFRGDGGFGEEIEEVGSNGGCAMRPTYMT